MPIRLDQFDNQDFDRGAPPGKEALWRLVRTLVFGDGLPVPSSFRVAVLRMFGAKVGEGVVIRGGCQIHFPWRLEIGDHVWIGERVTLLSLDKIIVEDHVCISQQAFVCTGSHDFEDETFSLQTAPIHIRAHSWIGATAFLGMGVEIGKESLVAAGAVLMESCPDSSFVKGNPAMIAPRR